LREGRGSIQESCELSFFLVEPVQGKLGAFHWVVTDLILIEPLGKHVPTLARNIYKEIGRATDLVQHI
jgi:hypothetical protein